MVMQLKFLEYYGCCRYRRENGRGGIDITSDKASESPLTGDTLEDQEDSFIFKRSKNKVLKFIKKRWTKRSRYYYSRWFFNKWE